MHTLIIIIIIIICLLTIYFFYTCKRDDKLNILSEKFDLIQNPNLIYSPQQEFYDKTIFPELNLINNKIIKEELNNYINKNNTWTEWPEYELWKNNNHNNQYSWTVIPLIAFGKPCVKNINMFPQTMNQIKQIPNVITAGFSKLGPGTKLSYHKGWAKLSNNVLRCHLGLVVPKKKCKILVTKDNNYPNLTNIKAMYQKENKWIIFDDSLFHSASNDSNQDRIVLILDIIRPPHIKLGTSDITYSEELDNFMNEFIK
jgi:beta-hydroxylase